MKQLNLYYVISTIILAVMMLIMVRTLEVTGWFEEHEQPSPAEQFRHLALGQFILEESGLTSKGSSKTLRINPIDAVDPGWLAITLDTLAFLRIRISDFEDEQVLLEIFQADSSGEFQRLEGCELLIAGAEAGELTGSTIGEFCGLSQGFETFYTLNLKVSESESSIEIENRQYDNQTLLSRKEYRVKRQAHDE